MSKTTTNGEQIAREMAEFIRTRLQFDDGRAAMKAFDWKTIEDLIAAELELKQRNMVFWLEMAEERLRDHINGNKLGEGGFHRLANCLRGALRIQ